MQSCAMSAKSGIILKLPRVWSDEVNWVQQTLSDYVYSEDYIGKTDFTVTRPMKQNRMFRKVNISRYTQSFKNTQYPLRYFLTCCYRFLVLHRPLFLPLHQRYCIQTDRLTLLGGLDILNLNTVHH